MIRMIQSMSSGHAKTYYTEALAKSDYYIGGQELNGTFQGRLSNRLGIAGAVTREAFFALCENRHPANGQPLTPRTKKDRKIGYDINFHVPKSVSILNALAKDNHIIDAFRHCVAATMREMEAQAKVRVRKGGVSVDRDSGELIWADFIHQTARPVEGFAPDPHLHAHCFVFNLAWDETEQRLKAGKFREINKEIPYYKARFHKRLADKLVELGYQVRPTAKAFEVEGIPQEVIALFSKRTDAIGRVAKEKGITNEKELRELGARTRAKKQQGLGMEELKAEWKNQIAQLEQGRQAVDNPPVRFSPQYIKEHPDKETTLQACIDYTMLHHFERASVVPFNTLATTALKHSIGKLVSADEVTKGLHSLPELIQVEDSGQMMCTTKEVLREEQKMVSLARAGKNSFAPMYEELPEIKATGQQGQAIRHVLQTSDMVSIVRGAAGAGKTTLMTEAVKLIGQSGKRVAVVAPTAMASRGVLRDEGFAKAETVAAFINNPAMQREINGQVLWVDEAGMLGTKDMAALLEITTKQNARLVLGGDTRQHASVVRGDALRILNTVAGISVAEVDKIYRQKDEAYRSAVADLSKGHIRDGFTKLDAIGAIKELSPQEGFKLFLKDYMAAVKAGKTALVIAPTHEQGERMTHEIRDYLKAAGYIGKREVEVERLKSLNLTAAQKTDWRNIEKGFVVQFNQNQKGIQRGSKWQVAMVREQQVAIRDISGQEAALDLSKPDQFDLYQRIPIPVAKGDKMRITRNGFDRERKRMDNGMVLDVISASKKSGLVLQNPQSRMIYRIGMDHGNIAHAHCVTSHVSQGKTVDEVFIAQPAATFPATNAKQFYVSVSRAREKVHIYTDDREELLLRASQTGDRAGALELVKSVADKHLEYMKIQELEKSTEAVPHIEHDKIRDRTPDINQSYEDYEPGL
jgi:conjugative relaxase-like TrwC/TraI family protein